MDASLFKKHITQRGFTYNYFRVSAEAGKPTLVLLHGFPSSSWDWHYQVDFFKPRGYGLVVPDMLGYAGTDKPTDAKFYIGSGLAQDIVDILDKEDVQKSVLIGHDWYSFNAACFFSCLSLIILVARYRGSRVVSRLANNYPDRFTAIGFLALAYLPPNPVHDPAAQSARIKQLVGRDLFGYWDYLAEEGADKTVEKNVHILLFPCRQRTQLILHFLCFALSVQLIPQHVLLRFWRDRAQESLSARRAESMDRS